MHAPCRSTRDDASVAATVESFALTAAHARLSRAAPLRAGLVGGGADGDLPANADTATLAAFYSTVLDGMSIKARDGATREELHGIATAALTAWDGLAGLK